MRYQLRYVRSRAVSGACYPTITHLFPGAAPHPGDDHYVAGSAGTPLS